MKLTKQIGSHSVKYADNGKVWRPGLEVIILEFILSLIIKRNDRLLAVRDCTHVFLPQGEELNYLKVQCCHQCCSVCLLLTLPKQIESQRVKCADNWTVWRTGSGMKTLSEEIEVGLKTNAGRTNGE